jgi:hypothetical protein
MQFTGTNAGEVQGRYKLNADRMCK